MKKNVGWSLVLGLMALAGLQSCQLVAGAIEVAREVKDFPMEIKLHDGTVLAGEARMPNGGTRDVNLKLADGTKKGSGVRGYRVSDGLEPEDARFQVCHGV